MICHAAMQWFDNGIALPEHQPSRGAQDFLVFSATMEKNFQGLCHQHGACSPALLLGMPLPGTQSNFPVLSDDSAMSVGSLSIFHTAATQELWPKPCWCPKRFGLELIQVPWSHPVPCLGKTSTDENGSMTKGREGKSMVSMWKEEKYHTKLFHGWMVLLGDSGIKW